MKRKENDCNDNVDQEMREKLAAYKATKLTKLNHPSDISKKNNHNRIKPVLKAVLPKDIKFKSIYENDESILKPMPVATHSVSAIASLSLTKPQDGLYRLKRQLLMERFIKDPPKSIIPARGLEYLLELDPDQVKMRLMLRDEITCHIEKLMEEIKGRFGVLEYFRQEYLSRGKPLIGEKEVITFQKTIDGLETLKLQYSSFLKELLLRNFPEFGNLLSKIEQLFIILQDSFDLMMSENNRNILSAIP